MRNQSSQWLIPLFLAAGAGLALWYYWAQISEPPPVTETETPLPPPVAMPSPEPLHPVEQVADDGADRPDLVPLPALGESDEYLKIEISAIFGPSIEEMLADSGLIERIVATVDNLPRSHVAERIRPVGRLDSPFEFDGIRNDSTRKHILTILLVFTVVMRNAVRLNHPDSQFTFSS